MQLLYVANRYERKPDLQRWLDGGLILVCDRYTASSIAYGEAQGLDPAWLTDMQKFLPPPALTILLDIAPETAVKRKAVDRDRYERDLAMQGRVRESYRRQAAANGWVVLDGERPKERSRRTSSSGVGTLDRADQLSARPLTDPRASAAEQASTMRRPPGGRSARTPHPRLFSTRAHASSVAPVVLTSSTSTTIVRRRACRPARVGGERVAHVR